MKESRWEVRCVTSYDFQSEEYKTLFAEARATAFQSPLWLRCVYDRLAPQLGAKAAIITIRRKSDSKLVALLPMVKRRYSKFTVAEFVDFGVSDYSTLVAASETVEELQQDRSIPNDIKTALSPVDVIVARKVRRADLPLFDLLGSIHKSKLNFNAHDTNLFAPYLGWREQSIAPSQRRFLDEKRRRLSRRGKIELTVAERPDDQLFVLHQIQSFREYRFRETSMTDILDDRVFVDFYRDIAQGTKLSRGYILNVDGEPVSAAFGLIHDSTFHIILTGFDFENYRNHSVGLLVVEDVINDCISRGLAKFDFTIGDQPYKRDFGTVATEMYSVWIGVSLVGRILAFLFARSSAVRRSARQILRYGVNPNRD